MTYSRHSHVYVVLLLLTAACGEFHTRRFTDPRDTPQDLDTVAPADASTCNEFIALQLSEDRDLTDLVVGVPFFRILGEETGAADLWLVTTGSLPVGLSLDPLTGALFGVPGEVGAGSFTVRVTAENQGGTCYLLDEAVYPVTVSAQCVIHTDCEALIAPDFLAGGGAAVCSDGRCRVSNGCPNDPRQRVLFLLGGDSPPAAGDDGLIRGGEVVLHERIVGQKNPDELRRRLVILFEEPEVALIRLEYTLPDNWPLPLRAGDPVALGLETSPAGGKALRVDGPGGISRLLSGPWVPGSLPQSLALPKVGSILPLACPSFLDGCGEQFPAAITFSLDRERSWTLSPSDITWILDPAESEAGAEALLARVGWSMFRGPVTATPACAWSHSHELSAFFLPADDCPGAVAKAESSQDQTAGQALAAPAVFEISGWDSFSPGQQGSVVTATWSIEEDPAGNGFARLEPIPLLLPDPVGLGNQRLITSAAGIYRVGLSVEDRKGRQSCIKDTIRFRVIPDPEVALRAELIWLSTKPEEGSLELYMRPSEGAAWDDPTRVCSPSSSLPESFSGAQCAAGDIPGGRPGLATLLDTVPTQTYGFAIHAPAINATPITHDPINGQSILLRLFCDGIEQDFTLPDGFSLPPGDLTEVVRVAPGCVLESRL